jgi:hypothetical protein
LQYNIYHPFGTRILKVKMPKKYVDDLNAQADKILGDEELSKKSDVSDTLAGNVKKEVAINHKEIDRFEQFLVSMSHAYVKGAVPKGWIDKAKASFIVWVVSQYAGDFNPIHIHDANLSGVAFLKIPPKLEEEYKKEDHHPTVGCLEFLGAMPNHFANHSYLVRPEVGDFYLFPSWLPHQAYPFRSEGERRSMSFNVHFKLDDSRKGVKDNDK